MNGVLGSTATDWETWAWAGWIRNIAGSWAHQLGFESQQHSHGDPLAPGPDSPVCFGFKHLVIKVSTSHIQRPGF